MKPAAVEQAMRRAGQAHQAGRLAEAGDIYRQVLAEQPDHPQALRLLGVIARQEGRLDEAVELLRRSIAADAGSAEAHHNLGNALREQGKLDAAGAAYSQAVNLRPDWAQAHGALGNVLRDQGQLDQAAAAYAKAIALKPGLAAGHFNLGKVLHEQGHREQAIQSYLKAIQLKPGWAEAYNSLGNVFWDEGKLDQALPAYAKAVELNPGHVAACLSMGIILHRQGRIDQSIACLQKAVRHNPAHGKAHLYLGDVLLTAGRRDEACAAYRRGIELDPDSPKSRFRLAALTNDRSATTAPARYVRDLFDNYAATFDKHLVENLHYHGPEQLLQSVQAATSRADLDVLDLGCGTGLCGVQFRRLARHLVGVDLSSRMIEVAAAREIYDQLLTADLTTSLLEQPARYDLVLAGDVLNYVGDLSGVMPAVAQALRDGGLFAFSIENYDGPGYFLHPEERFAHSITYVREQAVHAGLEEISAEKVVLRKQAGAEAAGWIVVLGKPPSALPPSR